MGISNLPDKSGIPGGLTDNKPSNPALGDTYYDANLGFLIIYTTNGWMPCNAPAAQPSIIVTDVGTGVASGSAQGSVAITEGTVGGKFTGFTVTASTGGYSATST